jgi:hypothetical protein
LDAIAALDTRDGFVAPSYDVGSRLAREIESISHCTPAILATEHAAGETGCLQRRFISAAPSSFADQTLAEISRIAAELQHRRAKRFEVEFHNTRTDPNDWGDQIVVAVRYVPQC